MRSPLFLPSFVLATVLFFLPTYDASEAEPAAPVAPPASKSHIITINDNGLSPSTLRMSKDDKFAFFLNDSSDSLITISLNYTEHATHCSSGNLKIQDNGTIRSTEPISPKDFAGSCFHDPGSYPFTVLGLKKQPQGIQGTIIIE
jgi:hypothetical protein